MKICPMSRAVDRFACPYFHNFWNIVAAPLYYYTEGLGRQWTERENIRLAQPFISVQGHRVKYVCILLVVIDIRIDDLLVRLISQRSRTASHRIMMYGRSHVYWVIQTKHYEAQNTCIFYSAGVEPRAPYYQCRFRTRIFRRICQSPSGRNGKPPAVGISK